MSSASRQHDDDDKPPRSRLPRPSSDSTSTGNTPATPLVSILEAMPVDMMGTSAPHHHVDMLCDTNETQELLDGFFALYAPPDQSSTSALDAARTPHRRVLPSNAGDVAEWQSADDAAKRASSDNGNDDIDREGDDEDPVGRSDGHHAQQSQYVPVEEEEEEEEEQENSGEAGLDEEDGGNDADTSANVEGLTAEEAADDSSVETAVPSSSPWPTKGPKAATGPDRSRPSLSTEPAASVAAPSSPHPHASPETTFWPFAHPPLSTALPLHTQTRAAFHTKRYGAFIKAYLGLSDREVRQAERRGRGICMIGVRKVTKYGRGTASSPISFSFSSPRLMPICKGIPSGLPNHPFRCVRPSNADSVRTQRVFLRHSVLAVEGDAVFCQLIDRAEMLYAVEQQRLDYAAAAAAAEGDAEATETKEGQSIYDQHGKPTTEPVMYPQFRKLPRVTEPYLHPNARCIALHYGLPDRMHSSPGSSSSSTATSARPAADVEEKIGETTATAATAHRNRFPRATLIAVVSTTRLEENAEIYVSMDSYYRCLDEVEWYRRCYSPLNARCGCRTSLGPCTSSAPASCCPTSAPQVGRNIETPKEGLQIPAVGRGDVYTGVKRFPAWPADLAYYHGVGKRHASTVAEGAFPFTLVELGAAPELGEGQKGVVASSWIPYGTCLLYCGPAVATRKVEKLVTERLLSGPTHPRDPASATTGDGGVNSRMYEGEAEDLSFATDDTYALGLGRHGVCFGQGLTRYINHRYNTSRFGNVELCSVMLSVPSEFGTEAKGGGFQRNASSLSSPPQQQEARRLAPGIVNLPSDPSLTEEAINQIRATVRKQHRRGGGSGGLSVDVSATTSTGAPLQPRGKRKQAPFRRAPRFFLEEKSFFVTVPFFLVTTDIAPGSSLLAWTYGEDYDAKLERQAVADGHIVPYADAVVLNRRLSTPSPGRRFQRYGGDYRFAVGVGDVVWRRRPLLLQQPALTSVSDNCGAAQTSQSCRYLEQLVPLPEEDLFVVVQTQRGSVEQVLLQPLIRVALTDAALDVLLREQHLRDYVSPHVSFNFLTAIRADGELPQRRRGGRGRGRGQTAASKGRPQAMPAWSKHWAVFQLPESIIASEPATLPLAGAEDALRRCNVATIESVGLLLPDIDYSVIHTKRPENRAGGVRGQPSRKGGSGGGGGSRLALDSSRRIAVNLDDLHHATHLVRTSAERATAVPVLLNGLLWPLFSARVERGGGPTGANGGSRVLPMSMRATPSYCRYGIHGDVSRQTNIDGTALYRARERPCDCTPPPLPALRTPRQPRRPATITASSQRRTRPRGQTGRPPCRPPTQLDHSNGLRVPASLSQCLAFYEGGLRVVVPPIAVEPCGYAGVPQDASSGLVGSRGREVNVLPSLPSIPVVWPQPDLPGTNPDATHRSPSPIATAACVGDQYAGNAAPTTISTTASAAVSSETPTASLGAVNPLPCPTAPALPASCSPERHALHATWGIAFCSVCGQPLHSSTEPCTSLTCPLGPHEHHLRSQHQLLSATAAQAEGRRADKYCILCGADLKSSAAAGGTTSSCLPGEPGSNQQTPQLPPYKDLLTRRDLHSVDEIMAHLLSNAEANGGKVKSPCGLPNCRLCSNGEGAVNRADAVERRTIGPARPDKWWEASIMGGCPAVAIIHHHYYR